MQPDAEQSGKAMSEQAKIHFHDGQRVKKEDLEFLQDNLLGNQQRLTAVLGKSGVVWGFKVTAVSETMVHVSKGLGYDCFSRPVILEAREDVPISLGDTSLFLCAGYMTRVTREHNGQPIQVEHGHRFILLDEASVNETDEIILAQIQPREGGYDIIQKGEWFIPPVHATHSGQFFNDTQGRWRYDGDPVVSAITPDFDSGWVDVVPNSSQNISHNLGSINLLVQLQRRTDGHIISNQGNGIDFYYELHDISVIRLFNETETLLTLDVRLWRLDADENPLLSPVADAGINSQTEQGNSFTLDGSQSLAFEGRNIVRYRWSLME